jgi:hypothetical protein
MANLLKQPQVEIEAVEATTETSNVSESPTNEEKKNTNLMGTGPMYTDRSGRVKMAIWGHEVAKHQLRYSITLKRSYKVKDGYKETSSLDLRDLVDAIHLLNEAYELLPKTTVSKEDNDGE